MTPTKEALLAKLNQQAEAAHVEATETAKRGGRRAPEAPQPMAPEHLEFPKWLYGAKGEAKLVENAEEMKALGTGWSESPVKTEAPVKSSKKE